MAPAKSYNNVRPTDDKRSFIQTVVATGGVTDIPFVNGKRHSTSSSRLKYGFVIETPNVNSSIHGTQHYRHPNGDVVEYRFVNIVGAIALASVWLPLDLLTLDLGEALNTQHISAAERAAFFRWLNTRRVRDPAG